MPFSRPRVPASVEYHNTENNATVYVADLKNGDKVMKMTLPELKEKYPSEYADYKALREREKKEARKKKN